MKKSLILCGLLILALTVNTGCQKKEVNDLVDDEKPGVSDSIEIEDEEEVVEEDELIKFQSDLIDFTKVGYISSETERNEDLEKAIIDYLDYDKDEDGKLVYYYNNVNLNGDEKEEAFVYLMGLSVSGSGGTTALIIDQENYEVISDFTLVQNPILISNEKTNGWNDIIMQVSGGGAEDSYIKLEFDGKTYPSNPSIAPELEEGTIVEGVAIIANTVFIDDGLEIE